MSTEPIAYTYEASEHCLGCTIARFAPENLDDEVTGTDSEGNEVRPVFEHFTDRDMTCGTCYGLINARTCRVCDDAVRWYSPVSEPRPVADGEIDLCDEHVGTVDCTYCGAVDGNKDGICDDCHRANEEDAAEEARLEADTDARHAAQSSQQG